MKRICFSQCIIRCKRQDSWRSRRDRNCCARSRRSGTAQRAPATHGSCFQAAALLCVVCRLTLSWSLVPFCLFLQYPHMLLTNFSKCSSHPHECMAVLYIHRDGAGRMDLIQNISGFKFVELLSLDFLLTASEMIKQQIIYRYFTVKNQVASLTDRLRDVQELVKAKSPSLMLAIKKQSASASAAAASNAVGRSAAPSPSSSPAPALQQHSRHSSSSNQAPHHSSNGSFGGTGGGGSFMATKRAVR